MQPRFLISTGSRLGEALALEWRDVDRDAPLVRIERALKVASGTVGSTKSDEARTVLIDPFLVDVLRGQRAAQRRSGRIGPLVFPSRAGTHLRHSAVWTHGHVKARAAAGVHPRLRIHDLRHTAATLWLAAGESIYFVKEQLGHADIRTTIAIYGHRDQEAAAAAAARAAAWWRNPAGTTSGTTGAISARDPRGNREATTGIEPV